LLLRVALLSILLTLISACGGGGGGGSAGGSGGQEAAVSDDNVTDNSGLPLSENPADIFTDLSGNFPLLAIPDNNQQLASCKSVAAVAEASTISGLVQYERIPLTRFGLNYAAITALPVRGVVVEAVEASNGECSQTVIATTLTNGNGEYGLAVDANDTVCIQVRSQMFRSGSEGGAAWNIQVTDNTLDDAPYFLVDNRLATPTDLPERNLLAAAGVSFGSRDYTQPRAAATYAILDSICEAVDTVLQVDSAIQLPLLTLHWSTLNNSAQAENDTSIAEGDIGGAFFRQSIVTNGGNIIARLNDIYLLGDEDNNTDEYDSHVITHEFAHYLSSNFSRYDALGGEHALGDHLDMRLAFEEGWADAFSGIALNSASIFLADDPKNYRNSLGFDQGNVSRFNLDSNNRDVVGWYSEASVFSIIYNLFDDNNDAFDTVSLGFTPIFEVLMSNNYLNSNSLTSIYTFINRLKQSVTEDTAIDTLVFSQDIDRIVDDFGSNEDSNNNDVAGADDVSPVYTELALNAELTLCSNDQYGTGSKLSGTQFLTINAESNRDYNFRIAPVTGVFGNGLASVAVYRRGDLITRNEARSRGAAINFSTRLNGFYVVTLAHLGNIDNSNIDTGRRCFTVLVE
jgi:hypothetical protein